MEEVKGKDLNGEDLNGEMKFAMSLLTMKVGMELEQKIFEEEE